MPQITSAQLDEMRRLGVLLIDLVDQIEDKPVVVTPEIASLVQKRVSDRICLACGQQALESDRMRRGQDSACYTTTRSRIRRGLVTERQLIEQGKLTPESAAPGRPARQDMSEQELKVAELADRYNNRKKPKP